MGRTSWVVALGITVLCGCSDGPSGPVPITTITIEGLPATLRPGESAQLSARALGSSGQVLTNRSITFSTSNTSVATVTAAGLLTAVAPGPFVVTASAEGVSGTASLTVNYPLPTVSAVDPNTINTGTAMTITVRGTDFFPASVVRISGVNKTTTFVSSTELRASIAATDFPTPVAAQVTVFNPTPGGGSSATLPLAVTANPCVFASQLPFGANVGATLDSADCRVLVSGNPFFEEYYFVDQPQNQAVSVRLNSNAFDPFLIVQDSARTVLALNDNVGAGNPNSLVVFFGPPRRNFLTATSARSGQSGGYSISATASTSLDPIGCQSFWLVNVSTTYTIPGAVFTSDCQLTIGGAAFLSDRFFMFLRAGQTITVTMASTVLDPYLIICDATCARQVQDDNSGGGTTARIVFTVQTAGADTG